VFIDFIVPTYLIMLATLIGLIVRGRWRRSRFFTLYIPLGLSYSLLLLVWPSRWKGWF